MFKKLFCLLALSPLAPAATVVYFNNFDSQAAGQSPLGLTVTQPPNTIVAVVADGTSPSGPNALNVTDNAGSTTGNTNPNFYGVPTGGNYGYFVYTFDYKMVTPSGNIQRTELKVAAGGTKKLDFRLDGNRLTLNLATNTAVAQSALFSSIAGVNWDADGWNNYSYEVNDATNTAIGFVNGVEVLRYTHFEEIDWTAGRFESHVGYSSTEGNIGYFDNITFAVPEPSTALLCVMASGLLMRRRR